MSNRIRFDRVLRQTVEAMPNAMMVINGTGQVVIMNAQGEQAFGYGRNEILGQPVEMLIPERYHPGLQSAFLILQSDPTASSREMYAVHKDGSEFPVEISSSRIETDDGPMVLSAIVDISHRRQEVERIRAALHEKDILLAETHHQVRNDLQIIYSLLGLQAAGVADQATQDLLRDSQNRVHSVALIHQTLGGTQGFESVDFALFVGALLSALIGSYGIDTDLIAIRVDVEPVRLPIGVAVPCGLMVNELITNALKHAFRGRARGEIRISLARESGNEVLLSVADNGIGLPDHVNAETTETIGLQLVEQLASQLDGVLSINRSDPTRFSLRFQF